MPRRITYKQQRPAGDVQFNVTPMIDCTFLLIIFFILTSQMASRSLAKLELHRPHKSQAIPSEQIETPNHVIVNVLSANSDTEDTNPVLSGRAERYEIDGTGFDVWDVEALSDVLRSRKIASGSKDFYVEIRADRRVDFSQVEPVMLAAAEAQIEKMYITALIAGGE